MADKEAFEKAKNMRRPVKGSLTRNLNAVHTLINAKRPPREVLKTFDDAKNAHSDLMKKHEVFALFLSDDDYEAAEIWMEECAERYTRSVIEVNEYVESVEREEEEKQQAPGVESFGVINPNGAGSSSDNTNHSIVSVQDGGNGIHEENAPGSPMNVTTIKPSIMKHEKPKLPYFHGDVRKYFIFKEDSKHAVGSRFCERDAIIAILRSCLGAEPAKLVEGVSSDLSAAWKYFDENYGDPRVVSDTVTADLERFRAIQPGEDHRFCDLVNHLRPFNILKEVKRPQDVDNTHITT